MTAALAQAGVGQALFVLAATAAGAAVLVVRDPRRRAGAVVAALVLGAVVLATVAGAAVLDLAAQRPAAAVGGLVVTVLSVAALSVLLRRRPAALLLLVVVTLPVRVPLPVGEEPAHLLLPLYAVIGAGCVARLADWLARRGAPGAAAVAGPDPPAAQAPPAPKAAQAPPAPVRALEIALAAVLVLYGLQSLYSTDVAKAAENVGFFYVPFALLFRLVADVRPSRMLLTRAFGLAVGLALVFALVGFAEYATGSLLIDNAKVLAANELKPYFRVNSLFFDPNIYGRFLALTMTALAAVLLWLRRRRPAIAVAAVLAVLWAALVLSLSQSSLAALLVGLAALAAVRWSARRVALVTAALVAVPVAVLLAAPGLVGLQGLSAGALDRATSGRFDLAQGGLSMVADRPLWGFGSGAFTERYRARERIRSQRVVAASHTIPLTVAAEQGLVGLAAYLALLATAFRLLFGGLRANLSRQPPSSFAFARVCVAAMFAALVLHTLVYAAFLEDPLTWTLLALGAALCRPRPAAAPGGGGPAPPERAAPAPAAAAARVP